MTTIKETHQLQSIHIHCLSPIHRRASIDQSRDLIHNTKPPNTKKQNRPTDREHPGKPITP
ncbi:unnamed protein product [Brassica oleracea var. botrytis]|uniref:Uncharacterized protein n=2 Tax=Brassica oleracea TaxID=3712 RepID=A0A0D3BBH4_BRAOL|nr:unnamed protein product [Brassica oleracea]